MDWITSVIDVNGIKTLYPPKPKYEDIPECSMCREKTQFLHFSPKILSLIKPEEKIPLFCGTVCAVRFMNILRQAQNK